MIKGVHAMFYSNEAAALREFLRTKLKIPFTDVGGGWLIFDLGEGDVGVHPTDFPGSPTSGTHNVSFYCDDLRKTVAELKANGVVFKDGIADRGYGQVIHFVMPGNVEVELFQPSYEKKSRPVAKAAKAAAKELQSAAKPKARAVKKATKTKTKNAKRPVARSR
ncbi:MAG: VOC family protein [Myxococcota bacterium]|nr:VOC family protein [Myxococcota bacterium]